MADGQEEEPWKVGSRSYAGWVPNVRSHLSFSMIGAAKAATTFTQPISGGVTRVVMVHQHREVNDYPLPAWLAKVFAPDIALDWVLVAQTQPTMIPITRESRPCPERDRQGMLLGTVYLLARLDTRAARAAQAEAIAGIEQLLRARRRKRDDEVVDLRTQVELTIGASGPLIQLKVALMRTGECRLWFTADPPGLALQQIDWIAQQAYYFIKDVVHDHTHHDETSDQITPLYPFGRISAEPGHSDEVAWRRETLWSLSREIERLNREGGLTDQRKSLGVIAYAEAFQASLMGHVRNDDEPLEFIAVTSVHDFDFKHLKDSIKASIDVNATRLTQKIQVAIAAVSVFLATTSLVSSLVSSHNGGLPKVSTGLAPGTVTLGTLEGMLPLLAWNPAVTGAALTTVLLGVIAYFLLDGRAGIYNGAQRWLSQVGRALAVTLTDTPRGQWWLLFGYHLVMILLTLAGVAVCIGILAGSIYF